MPFKNTDLVREFVWQRQLRFKLFFRLRFNMRKQDVSLTTNILLSIRCSVCVFS